jgi:hypothetical protein
MIELSICLSLTFFALFPAFSGSTVLELASAARLLLVAIARTKVPDHKLFRDFVCRDCFNRASFLQHYTQYRAGLPDVLPPSTVVEVTTTPATDSSAKNSECKCSFSTIVASPSLVDTFWVSGWRNQLCTCPGCKQTYKTLSLTYILEEPERERDDEEENDIAPTTDQSEGPSEPTLASILTSTAPKRPYVSILDSAEQAFLKNPGMDHESKLNVIQAYTDMSEKLKAFLDTFARSGKVVTKEDIDGFFTEFGAKRRKT